MTLKENLEAIWQDPKCLCPSHRVWWTQASGYWIHGMCYKKGRLVALKGTPRKKGYSYLMKNYRLAWRWKER